MSDKCITNSGQLKGNHFCPLQGSLLDKVLEYESPYDKHYCSPITIFTFANTIFNPHVSPLITKNIYTMELH